MEKGKWIVGIELSFLGHDEVHYIYIFQSLLESTPLLNPRQNDHHPPSLPALQHDKNAAHRSECVYWSRIR